MKTQWKLLPLAMAILTLAACNPGTQDGSSSDNRQNMNGLAVDGRIANGRVWVDRNRNYQLDRDFEPFARTDAYGYFSYRPELIDNNGDTIPSIDYCDLPSDDERQRHCLLYGSSDNNAQILIRGGTDVETGERLKGIMVMETTLSEASRTGENNQPVLSPISSVLAESESQAQRNQILDNILHDLDNVSTVDLLRQDFSAGDTRAQRRLLANAVSMQNMQDLIAGLPEDVVEGNSLAARSTAQNRQQRIIQALRNRVDNDGSPLAWEDDQLEDLMNDSGVTQDQDRRTRSRTNIRRVNTVLASIDDENIDDDNVSDEDRADHRAERRARLRAAEVAYQLARRSVVDNDDDAEETLEELERSEDDKTGFDKLTESLRSSTDGNGDEDSDFDLRSVSDQVRESRGDRDQIENVVNSNRLGSADWPNTWRVLGVDPDDENADEVDESSYVAIYLSGRGDNATGGTVSACITAQPADEDERDDENTLVNEVVTGSWDRLSSGRVVLDLRWKQIEREGQLIARSPGEDDEERYRLVALDDDGERQEAFALNNADAAERLNEENPTRPTRDNNTCENIDSIVNSAS